MHGEALAIMAQTLGFDSGRLLPKLATLATRDPLLVSGDALAPRLAHRRLASRSTTRREAHEVEVPEFEIDAQPVTWAQYCEFVEDGGYDEPHWWQADGWHWLQREGRRTPRYVDQMRQGVLRTASAGWSRVPMTQPVMHVSWYEADAWCRWAGRRLPSEVEWEIAAHQGGSRGFRWGDVWEWTATTFRPYPGFAPGP